MSLAARSAVGCGRTTPRSSVVSVVCPALNAGLVWSIACVAGGVNGGGGEFWTLLLSGASPGFVVIGVPMIVLEPSAALLVTRLFAMTFIDVRPRLAAPVLTVAGRWLTRSLTVMFWNPSL